MAKGGETGLAKRQTKNAARMNSVFSEPHLSGSKLLLGQFDPAPAAMPGAISRLVGAQYQRATVFVSLERGNPGRKM